MTVIEVKSEAQFTELTTSVGKDKLTAIYFHTPWAAPCIQMNTVFQQLSDVNQDVLFLSVNADDLPEISEVFDVTAVPFTVFVQDGTIQKELSGADPKQFVAALQELQNGTGNSSTEPTQESTPAPLAAAPPAEGSDVQQEETEEALNERLQKLVSAAPVMLFMKGTPAAPQCGFSRQMVAILREHQVRFGFFDILKDDVVRQGLKKYSDWPTYPQLYINGELQGGLDIIKESLEEDPDFFTNAVNGQ